MTTLSGSDRLDWLRLARAEGVGAGTFAMLMERYGAPARALEALPALAAKAGRGAAAPSREDVALELAAGELIGARLLTLADPDYPPLLASLTPPPAILWVLGDASLLSRRSVAIVGARVASAGALRLARTLAAGLGEAGYAVVSGLARGVDGAAHQGALPFGTIAVLGGGVDDIYPPEHAALHAAIAERGCLVSESTIGRTARAADFPRRNRIIAGLSLGVVVVEAELRSGSLITARLANEQGREVMAIPGSPLDPRTRGSNDLIRQGAALVEEAEDVIQILEGLRSLSEPASPGFERPPAPCDPQADNLAAAVEALLSPTPAPLDEVARAVGAPTPQVMAALSELALAGRAELLPGGLVARAG